MNPREIVEDGIDGYYKQLRSGERRGLEFSRYRRLAAYSLKCIAGGGSLIIATGLLNENWTQALGISALLAIFIDTTTSNFNKLLAEVQAGYAFRSLGNRVKGNYDRELALLQSTWGDDDADDEQKLFLLLSKTHKELQDGIKKIQDRLEKSDVDGLRSLSLDDERGSS